MMFKAATFSVIATGAHLRTRNHQIPAVVADTVHRPSQWASTLPFVEMECGAEAMACDVASTSENEGTQGFFVCREMEQGIRQTICIVAERGLEADMCGCCNELCTATVPKN